MRCSIHAVHPGNPFLDVQYIYELNEEASDLLDRARAKHAVPLMVEPRMTRKEVAEHQLELEVATAKAIAIGGKLVDQRFTVNHSKADIARGRFARKKELVIALTFVLGPAILVYIYFLIYSPNR